MGEYKGKDADSLDIYFGAMGGGVTTDPFYGIPADFYTEIIKGNVAGHNIVHKYGRNPSTSNGSYEGILQASSQFNFLTSATTVRVKAGGDANDTAVGTGAQAVTVEGLDDTGAFVSESIELAGASASSVTTALFWRVFRVYITSARVGTYGGSNVGDIVIENGTGGTDLIQITAGEGQSQYGAYAIPLGKTGYLLSVNMQSESSKASNFQMYTREGLTDFTTPFEPVRLKSTFDGVIGSTIFKPKSPINTLTELTDIWFEAEGAGAISSVSIDFEILLVDN